MPTIGPSSNPGDLHLLLRKSLKSQYHAAKQRICLMRPLAIILSAAVMLTSCTTQTHFDPTKLDGQPFAQVVQNNHLNSYHSWPETNTPPNEDQGITYFLDHGDLTFKFSTDPQGHPTLVHNAQFRPSKKSPEERFRNMNTAWSKWVNAHRAAQPTN